MGALIALHRRGRTGRGQVVDTAIYESVLAVMESTIPEWVLAGHRRERTGPVLPNVAPSNVYPTADGDWVLIAANADSVFARLLRVMGRADLADDATFCTHESRTSKSAEVDGMIAAWTASNEADHILALLDENAVPAGRIYTAENMVHDPHFAVRSSIVSVPHDDFGEFPMQNVFPRLSTTPGRVRWTGARLGAHTDDVLTEAGFPADEIERFRAEGVI